MKNRKRLGEIFVASGLITEKTLERALARSKRQNKKVGMVLEEIEMVTGEELASALAVQYGHRVVSNFARYAFPPELFKLIPEDVAMQHLLFPLKIENNKLAVAMADPTETKIVSNIAANNDLTLVPFIATRRDIFAAIARHYLGRDLSASQEKSVLVAEDNKLVYTMLSNVLSKEGYRVILAQDGMDAYKSAIAESPHVIITDKEMPKLGGYGLFDALRGLPETRHIPIILLTGDSSAEEESRAFEKGFFDFITKPVKEVTLVTRVKRAFQSVEREFINP